MSDPEAPKDFTYQLRARLADNLFVHRRRAGYTHEKLAERAMVSMHQIGAIENGRSLGQLHTWVRLAGALSLPLDELLAGMTWTPGEIEFEIDAGYAVEFDFNDADSA